MYQKVLVPLDGSELAECALSQVRKLVRGGHASEVVLLRVIEIETIPIPKPYARNFDLEALARAHRAEAQQYLKDIQSQLVAEGIRVKTEIVDGRAAQAISDYVDQQGIDLIVIATHGHTGIAQLMFGSVALRVLHDSQVPVLLIRPKSSRS